MLKPISTNGLKAIWQDLDQVDLKLLDNGKCAAYKTVLGLHKSTTNKLVIIPTETNFIAEEWSAIFGTTKAFRDYIEL